MPADSKPLLTIAATFTAQPIEQTISFWLRKLELPFEIKFAAYNQIFQELLGEGGLLLGNRSGINVILLRLEDWQGQGESQVEQSARDFVVALRRAASSSSVPHVVLLCPSSPAAVADGVRGGETLRAEAAIAGGLKDESNVYVVTSAELSGLYPVSDYYSPHTDEMGHIPYTPEFFTALGTMVARRMWALRHAPSKVIALDCDGTLWRGTCGEDGPDGVHLEGPWKALQQFMVEQHDAGMLLCICSKNSQEDVMAVFDRRREEMPLKKEHIVSWRVNWKAKSENLRDLASELSLGLDSFIMVDDNPLETAEIGANSPEVLTLQLPPDPSRIESFLSRVWAFDQLKVTAEDQGRTELYRANARRESARAEAPTMDEFLNGLRLKIEIAPVDPTQWERVAQLTQRTNQFNVSGIRRLPSELKRLDEAGERRCLVVQVSDRFGDYGMVGAILYAESPQVFIVDSFLLSCRALGRKVEHQMLSHLGKLATERGASRIDIPFVPSDKNQPALNFLESLGGEFKHEADGAVVFQFPSSFAAAAHATRGA